MPTIPHPSLRNLRPRGTQGAARAQPPVGVLVCACGLYQHRGRWHEGQPPSRESRERVCPACARQENGAAVGRMRIPWRLAEPLDEVVGLIQDCERLERAVNPLERLLEIKRVGTNLFVSTTGPHLARRIANRLARRFHEKPRFRFGASRGELRVDWPDGRHGAPHRSAIPARQSSRRSASARASTSATSL